jgi:hypothetical protein
MSEATPPHLFVQWKGTSICADFHCACGYRGHMDREGFAYYVRCPECKQAYEVQSTIKLEAVKLEPEESFVWGESDYVDERP